MSQMDPKQLSLDYVAVFSVLMPSEEEERAIGD
jgi:hypothetical protein